MLVLGTTHSSMACDDGTSTQDVQVSSVASLLAASAAASSLIDAVLACG